MNKQLRNYYREPFAIYLPRNIQLTSL